MKIFLLLISLFILQNNYAQQRRCNWQGSQYIHADSTLHPINNDSTLLLGPNTLYLETAIGTQVLTNFSSLYSEFIINFEMVNPNQWYIVADPSQTLVHGNYFGSILY